MSQKSTLEALISAKPLLTAADLRAADIHRQAVARAVADGLIERVADGVYRTSEVIGDERAELAAAVPDAVVCLLTAGAHWDLIDQVPTQIWVGVPHAMSRPPQSIGSVELRVVRWRDDDLFTIGVETVDVADPMTGNPYGQFRITGRARTVVDLVRHDSIAGGDLGVAAFGQYVRDGHDLDELQDMAERLLRGQDLAKINEWAELARNGGPGGAALKM